MHVHATPHVYPLPGLPRSTTVLVDASALVPPEDEILDTEMLRRARLELSYLAVPIVTPLVTVFVALLAYGAGVETWGWLGPLVLGLNLASAALAFCLFVRCVRGSRSFFHALALASVQLGLGAAGIAAPLLFSTWLAFIVLMLGNVLVPLACAALLSRTMRDYPLAAWVACESTLAVHGNDALYAQGSNGESIVLVPFAEVLWPLVRRVVRPAPRFASSPRSR